LIFSPPPPLGLASRCAGCRSSLSDLSSCSARPPHEDFLHWTQHPPPGLALPTRFHHYRTHASLWHRSSPWRAQGFVFCGHHFPCSRPVCPAASAPVSAPSRGDFSHCHKAAVPRTPLTSLGFFPLVSSRARLVFCFSRFQCPATAESHPKRPSSHTPDFFFPMICSSRYCS
jgi:hypothetical protein